MGEMADWVIEQGLLAESDPYGDVWDEAAIEQEQQEDKQERQRLRRNYLARQRYAERRKGGLR